jgi:hypothetical protein
MKVATTSAVWQVSQINTPDDGSVKPKHVVCMWPPSKVKIVKLLHERLFANVLSVALDKPKATISSPHKYLGDFVNQLSNYQFLKKKTPYAA